MTEHGNLFSRLEARMEPLFAFFLKNETRLSTGALFVGFMLDLLTLPSLEAFSAWLVVGAYLFLATGSIVLLRMLESAKLFRAFGPRLRSLIPLLQSFSFGALLSALFVYYSRSGFFLSSWPFLFLLAFLMVSNEWLKIWYRKMEVELSVFFFLLSMVVTILVPIFFNKIGTAVFLFSSLLSIALMILFLSVLLRILPKTAFPFGKIFLGCSIVLALLHGLYFSNQIPPIPLSLRAADVYQFIERVDGQYIAREIPKTGIERIIGRRTYPWIPGEPIYFWSAVYAPAELETPIIHEWQYWDEGHRAWVSKSRVSFPIIGGREGGYRGYSITESATAGKWRVVVKTKKGEILGRETFRVVPITPPLFVQKITL